MVFFQYNRLGMRYGGNRIFLLFFDRGNTIRVLCTGSAFFLSLKSPYAV